MNTIKDNNFFVFKEDLQDSLEAENQTKTSSVAKKLFNRGCSLLSGTVSVVNKLATPRNIVLATAFVGAQEVMAGPFAYSICMGGCLALGFPTGGTWAMCHPACALLFFPGAP